MRNTAPDARRRNTGSSGPAPVLLRGGFPYAELESSRGRRQLRPVLFAGYGHFTDVIRDLPEFSSIGANLIQIEIGPSSIFPKGREKR